MGDFWRIRGAVPDADELAEQAIHQRFLRGFRREEEDSHRRRLLYGDDHLERSTEEVPHNS